MRGVSLALFMVSFAGAFGVAQPPDVEKVLKEYYEGRAKDPPYEREIARLSAADIKEREQAAAWLIATLDKTHSDEVSGKSPWRATPFWGRSAENPARELRTSIAHALADSKELTAAAVPVVRWFFEKEHLLNIQHDAANALAKLEGAEAAKLRREVIEKPHANLVVLAAALQQSKQAKESISLGKLLPLCSHHRAHVRDAARALHVQLGGKDLVAFDPAAAMRIPSIVRLLKSIDDLLIDKPPKDAEWIVASYKVFDNKKVQRYEWQQKGWLIKGGEKSLEILTPYGWNEVVRASSELTRDNDRENWRTCSVAKGKIEDEVARVEEIRKEGARNFEFSEQGGLTGQFKGNGAGLYELILSVQLHTYGHDALAARVLFPALDTLYSDDDAIDIVRREMGQIYGYRMLVAFVGDRDYERAEALAKTITDRYPNTIFHRYAVRLARELPQRREDFVTFKLPTDEAWNEMKQKMNRAEQIDFLCKRYRLLNYFQMGQPGGYMPGDTQYAEPCGMTRNAAWGLHRGKTEVINPETELTGAISWGEDKKKPRGMKLKLADIPVLSAQLREDWTMPTVSFWRDFAADRSLETTRPHFIRVINSLAKRDICQVDNWEKLSPAEIEKEIERINRWALENANKSDRELHWDTLQELLAAGKSWNEGVGEHASALLVEKDDRAFEVLRKMLGHKASDANHILELYLEHDAEKAKDLAPKYLKDPSLYTRFTAAQIVYQTGDGVAAREVFGDFLEQAELEGKAQQIVELLIKENSPAARAQLQRVFKNRELVEGRGFHSHGRSSILRRCADAGFSQAYAYYLKQIDNHEVAYTSYSKDDGETKTTYAQANAEEIVGTLAPQDPAIQEIVKKFPKVDDRIPHLKKWLQGKVDVK